MALMTHTHVLRQKTSTGYVLTQGFHVEGLGFMMISPLRGDHTEEIGRYRIICDLSEHEIATQDEARARGWFGTRILRHRQQFEHTTSSANVAV
jgi:hypothetical protein